jgi:hypothetical protein
VIEEGKLKVYSENYVKFYNIAGDIIIEVNQIIISKIIIKSVLFNCLFITNPLSRILFPNYQSIYPSSAYTSAYPLSPYTLTHA